MVSFSRLLRRIHAFFLEVIFLFTCICCQNPLVCAVNVPFPSYVGVDYLLPIVVFGTETESPSTLL